MRFRVAASIGILTAVVACSDSTEPVGVQAGQFVAVAAGRAHACAIDTIGRAWCWGENSRGQTGVQAASCPACVTSPAPVQGDVRFVSISSGSSHTCGVATDGTAYCWGDNNFGQLGAGNVGVCIALYLCSDVPRPVLGGFLFKSITAGSYGTCGITTADVLKCWGYQMFSGNLSLVSPTTVRFSANGDSLWSFVGHTDAGLNGCGITNNGVPACWGQNSYGQVGVGTITSARLNPVAITLDGVVKSISNGGAFACALTNLGEAYCWGRSVRGGLAVGADAVSTPCSATAPDACFVIPLKVIGGMKFSQLAVGSEHVCGLDVLTSEAYCWGANTLKAIGAAALGTNPVAPSPFPAGYGAKYVSLSAGQWFTCGLMSDKNVSCWGANIAGQLGQPTTLYSSAVPAIVRGTAP